MMPTTTTSEPVRDVFLRHARAREAEEIAGLTARVVADTGRGLDLAGADLSGLDLSGMDLHGATFNRASLHGTKLARANLTGATFICAGMERTDCRGAFLAGAYVHALAAQASTFDDAHLGNLLDGTGSLFHGCSMVRTYFGGARLAGATFYQCDLHAATFATTQLQGATFNECVLDDAVFNSADVADVTITKCLLHRARFRGAHGARLVIQRPTGADGLVLMAATLPALRLAEVRARDVDATGLGAVGLDLLGCTLVGSGWVGATLTGARITESVLDDANFANAVLIDAALRRSSCVGAVFAGVQGENLHAVECAFTGASFTTFAGRAAVFRDCDFARANLTAAYLYRAILTGDPPRACAFTDARLTGANLVQAYLAVDASGADLRGIRAAYARLNQSVLINADLTGAALYQASLVKTECTGATMTGVGAPFFADRCPGLDAALAAAGATEAQACVRAMGAAARMGAGGST